MLPSLEKTLFEFERLTLDDKVYLILRSDEELDVCIHFIRVENGRNWNVWYKEAAEASRQNCSRAHFPSILQAFRINESSFITEISGKLLTQAAFADEFVREVAGFLGEEAVRASILNTQEFMDALKAAVTGIIETQRSAEQKLAPLDHAPQHAHTLPEKNVSLRSKLRVIKND